MKHLTKHFVCTTALLSSCLLYTPNAAVADNTDHTSFSDALTNGRIILDARYRLETVDDDGVENTGTASTLRTRLGYETARFYGFSALAEATDTTLLGGENFNDSINGNTDRGLILDPEGTAVNRALIQYHNIPKTTVTFGRQTLKLDNDRFITDGNFRQKQKTFDQAHIVTDIIPHVKAHYAYMWKVHDDKSSDNSAGAFDTDNHIINISTDIIPHVRVAAYGYLHDFEDSPKQSVDIYGVHFDGSVPLSSTTDLLYQGDWATQEDSNDNTADLDLDFFFLEPGIRYNNIAFKLGYLNFEGDGTNGFQTPLGDVHPFSGWAEVFASTPADGLEEYYAQLEYSHGVKHKAIDSISYVVAYHEFEAENTGQDYGDEIDIGIYATFAKHYTASIEYANFSAESDAAFSDTERFWLTFGVKF